ncbi:MAG: hypothetical protein Q7R31_00430 [Candidatus Levybacteria bacterium]|nr:hypothetical protein [Candidatus Levybacteria bacterium]
MSIETGERAGIGDGFRPMEGFNYNGSFSTVMQVNEEAINKAFGIAGLAYGGIDIKSMPQSGKDIDKGLRKNPLLTTAKVNNRWRIEIDDVAMVTKLVKEGSGGGNQKRFIQQFDSLMKAAVLECVIKEKHLETQSEDFSALVLKTITLDFSALALKTFPWYDIARCWLFLYPKNGITLVRESK